MSDTATATTTTTTPADELHEAAARAREHLLPAVAARVLERDTAVVVICGNHDEPAEICRNCHYFDVQDRVLARLVASLLNVREPLAALIDEYARWAKDSITDYEEGDGPVHESDYCDGKNCQCFNRSLAVARAINGGAA